MMLQPPEWPYGWLWIPPDSRDSPGFPWSPMEWNPLESCGKLWNPMESYGILSNPVESYGILWNPMESFGPLLSPMESRGILWTVVVL